MAWMAFGMHISTFCMADVERLACDLRVSVRLLTAFTWRIRTATTYVPRAHYFVYEIIYDMVVDAQSPDTTGQWTWSAFGS
eukprot:5920784-Pleurochrysis_carterae.AAC.2